MHPPSSQPNLFRRLNRKESHEKAQEIELYLSDKNLFLATLAYGKLSALELASIEHSRILDLKIVDSNGLVALIECDGKTAGSLITRLGGSYKLAKVCGSSIESLLDGIILPENPKFAWTISGYGVSSELLEETRQSMRSLLKDNSLGKSRYIPPDVDIPKRTLVDGSKEAQELKIKNLSERVLHPAGSQAGFDVVVASDQKSSKTLFGFTIKTSDHAGFEKRDFSRSYQNPTMTIGPRLARVLVNLAMTKQTGCLLDPFCGIGTILQEALVTGYDICGVDISSVKLERCKTNLKWLRSHFGVSQRLRQVMMRGDASSLDRETTPRIDGVATEPILLPVFPTNPSHEEGSVAIKKAFHVYRKTLESLRHILDTGTRLAFIAPTIVDSAGRELKFEGERLFDGLDYRMFDPKLAHIESKYPIRVSSSRKKMIQREVYVMDAV